MCLVKKSIFPRFTLRDKIVYKIVYLDPILNKYVTPFRDCPITLNKEYKGAWIYSNLIKSLFVSEIHEGYIHSIKDLKSAKLCIKKWSFHEPLYIIEAIIPKYTIYWNGIEDNIASRRIKYIDKICKIHGNREEIYPCRMT